MRNYATMSASVGKTPEEIEAYKKRWRESSPTAKRFITAAAKRAKQVGLPCTSAPWDFELPSHCPVFGVELRYYDGKPLPPGTTQRATAPNSATLDRIDPQLGYVPGNVAIISHRANTLKNAATPEDLRLLAEWVATAGRPASLGS